MFQIGDRRWRIADVRKASCLVSPYEYTDIATTSASKPVDLACGRHSGHCGDTAEDATSHSCFKAVATFGNGGGSELRRSSRRPESFRLRALAPAHAQR